MEETSHKLEYVLCNIHWEKVIILRGKSVNMGVFRQESMQCRVFECINVRILY